MLYRLALASGILLGLVVLPLLAPSRVHATEGSSAQLLRLSIDPEKIVLTGARATQQLLVTGLFEDGSAHDLTNQCRYESSAPKIVDISEKGVLRPVADGSATVTARRGRVAASLTVTVVNAADRSYDFAHDVLPIISRLGCNQMGCHGSPKGKKDLHLSLFGAEPDADYRALTRAGTVPLLDSNKPAESLLLRKALGDAKHGGGAITTEDDPQYRLLADWVAHGAPRGNKETVKLSRLAVYPRDRVLSPKAEQPLLVEAIYSDGSTRDVTALAGFVSTDDQVAGLANGVAKAGGCGEAVIIITFAGQTAVSRLIVPQAMTAPFPQVPSTNRIDDLVFAKLRKLNVPPSELSNDAEFLRRVYLDVIGLLPTPEEARAFLSDSKPDKRARLIDSLLQRPEYTDMWTLKWCDLLRVNRGFPVNLQEKGMTAYHKWVHDSIAANKPMDRFVRELLTAEGSGYEVGPANFFRVTKDPQGMAEQTAALFLGVRLDCAHCHNHPFEQITWDDNYGLSAFFTRVKIKRTKMKDEEVITLAETGSIRHAGTNQVVKPRLLDGNVVKEPAGSKGEKGKPPPDLRLPLANWITSAENPYFARNLANRVWFWLLGRGLVHEPDDFRSTNPPSNPELLDFLAGEFRRSGCDMKHLFRIILNSRTYQLSSRTNRANESDQLHSSHYHLRRLSAEQMLDAISQATGSAEKFAGLPAGTRAVQLPDGNVRSPFLDVFGRPKRAVTCECERSAEAHVGQSLLMVCSDQLEAKLGSPDGRVAALIKAKKSDEDVVEELYLATLSRFPTAVEKARAVACLAGPTGQRRERAQDLLWVLLNTKEFQFNH